MKKVVAIIMLLVVIAISYAEGKAEGRKTNVVEINVPYEGAFEVENVKAIATAENGLTFALTNDGKVIALTHSKAITGEAAQKMKALYEKHESR